MQRNISIIFAVIILLPLALKAQFHLQRSEALKANSNWFFGEVGINHNQSPTQLVSTRNFYDSIASNLNYRAGDEMITVSHPETGDLRFIATRYQLFDKNFGIVPNGKFKPSDLAYVADRTLAVIPVIEDNERYYFVRSSYVDSSKLDIFIFDMSLNSGLGDIDTSQEIISITHQIDISLLSVVPGNNCDYWLIAYSANESGINFYVYNVNRNGIDTIPVISTFAHYHYRDLLWGFDISPNRETIAYHRLSYYIGEEFNPTNFLNFLNFNLENGQVTKSHLPAIELRQEGLDVYGNFSPDNNYYLLYSLFRGDSAIITKYDLREYTNNYRPSSLVYSPFSYIPYRKGRHLWYEQPIFLFKQYGDDLYFPIYTCIEVSPPISPGPDVYNVIRQVSGIAKFSPQNGLTWDEAFVSFTAEAPKNSIYSNRIDVTYPYLPNDTIPHIAEDSILCLEQDKPFPKIDMKAREGFGGYIWNDGTQGSEKSITEPGKYWVFYEGGCGTRVDTFIYQLRVPEKMLPFDTILCEQRFPFKIEPKLPATEFLWEDFSTDGTRSIYHPGDYRLTYVIHGCVLQDSIKIESKYCPCDIFIPNAFSPNNDGLNDYFKPTIALGCVPMEYSFKIFNRYGQVVYVSFNEFDRGWDGTYNGKPANMDTYYYELHFNSRAMNEKFFQNGQLTLTR